MSACAPQSENFKFRSFFRKKNWAALPPPPRDRVSDSHVQKISKKFLVMTIEGERDSLTWFRTMWHAYEIFWIVCQKFSPVHLLEKKEAQSIYFIFEFLNCWKNIEKFRYLIVRFQFAGKKEAQSIYFIFEFLNCWKNIGKFRYLIVRFQFTGKKEAQSIYSPDCKNVAISVNFWASSEIFTDLRSAFDSGSDKHLKTSVASIFPTRTIIAYLILYNLWLG